MHEMMVEKGETSADPRHYIFAGKELKLSATLNHSNIGKDNIIHHVHYLNGGDPRYAKYKPSHPPALVAEVKSSLFGSIRKFFIGA